MVTDVTVVVTDEERPAARVQRATVSSSSSRRTSVRTCATLGLGALVVLTSVIDVCRSPSSVLSNVGGRSAGYEKLMLCRCLQKKNHKPWEVYAFFLRLKWTYVVITFCKHLSNKIKIGTMLKQLIQITFHTRIRV